MKEGVVTNCKLQTRLHTAPLADTYTNNILVLLPHCSVPHPSSSVLLQQSRTLSPFCLLIAGSDCSAGTGAKPCLAKFNAICVPIFAQILFKGLNFPVVACLGQMYLFYRLVLFRFLSFSNQIYKKIVLNKKLQHFLFNSSQYIYQKSSVVKFQCLFPVRNNKDFTLQNVCESHNSFSFILFIFFALKSSFLQFSYSQYQRLMIFFPFLFQIFWTS